MARVEAHKAMAIGAFLSFFEGPTITKNNFDRKGHPGLMCEGIGALSAKGAAGVHLARKPGSGPVRGFASCKGFSAHWGL